MLKKKENLFINIFVVIIIIMYLLGLTMTIIKLNNAQNIINQCEKVGE